MEVERVVYQHPAVLECAVVGIFDPKWSEAVTAFCVLKPEAAGKASAAEFEQQMIDFIKTKAELSAYKVPKRVVVVQALPKDTQGKILKRELRKVVSQ